MAGIQQALFGGYGAVGDFESIATVSVGGGGSTNIDFTSIPQTYTHLQIRGIVRLAGGSDNRFDYMRVGNGSVDSGTNYSAHLLYGNGASALADNTVSGSSIPLGNVATAFQTASVFACFVIDILDYANTSKYKTTRTLVGFDNNGSGKVTLGSGNWRSTSAIDTIRLFGSGEDTSQYSSFALYGVK